MVSQSSYQYRNSHYRDKMVSQSFYQYRNPIIEIRWSHNRLISIWIPIIEIRWSHNRLISIGIPIVEITWSHNRLISKNSHCRNKMVSQSSYQYRNSHYRDKMVSQSSYQYSNSHYRDKMVSQSSKLYRNSHYRDKIDGLVQDCSNSIADALELLQSALSHRDGLILIMGNLNTWRDSLYIETGLCPSNILVRFKSGPLAAFSFRAHLAAHGTKKQREGQIWIWLLASISLRQSTSWPPVTTFVGNMFTVRTEYYCIPCSKRVN